MELLLPVKLYPIQTFYHDEFSMSHNVVQSAVASDVAGTDAKSDHSDNERDCRSHTFSMCVAWMKYGASISIAVG